MKKLFVSDLKAGDAVEELFVLAEKRLGRKKDGNPYLNVVLADKTGRIDGVAWDNVEQMIEGVVSNDFVTVTGSVSEYKGKPQLVLKGMTKTAPGEANPTDFLPGTPHDVEAMFARLMKIADTVEADYLKALFQLFWEDEEFVRGLKNAPAGKMMHHAYLGGLLEHCLSMAALSDRIARHYSGVDRDLLIAGAIFHDIGKVRELEYALNIDYSDEGRLLSHIVIGIQMLDEKLKKVADFPEKQACLLRHMIVSHHGNREFGSPEPPKTIEAVLLNYIDEIDSRVNAIREFIKGEDPNEKWTSYHRLLGRQFFMGAGE
ncbi:MAG: HD domain-containing protein [Desulfobacterales bacterium]|nr:HD domain-containing protein [Desulfobacterales bacterium]